MKKYLTITVFVIITGLIGLAMANNTQSKRLERAYASASEVRNELMVDYDVLYQKLLEANTELNRVECKLADNKHKKAEDKEELDRLAFKICDICEEVPVRLQEFCAMDDYSFVGDILGGLSTRDYPQ